ncbi:MAG: hypothetical protein M1812_004666 [Candelaria pacifica]|nr:MAG: hypothetical protein M1812_004666 [Candelaria pacifica]
MASHSRHAHEQQAPAVSAADTMEQRRIKNHPYLRWDSYKDSGVSYLSWRNTILQTNLYDEVTEDDIFHDWLLEINKAQKAGMVTAEEAKALINERLAPSAKLQLLLLEIKYNHLFSESYGDKLFLKTEPILRGTASRSTAYFILDLSSEKILYIPDTTKATLDNLSAERFFDELAGLNPETIIPREIATSIWEYVIQNVHGYETNQKKFATEVKAYKSCNAYWDSELDVNFEQPNLLLLPIPVKGVALNEDSYVKLVRFTQHLNPTKPVNPNLMGSAWIAYCTVYNDNLLATSSAAERKVAEAAETMVKSDRVRRWWVAVEASMRDRVKHYISNFLAKHPNHPMNTPIQQQSHLDHEMKKSKHWIDTMIIVDLKTMCVPLCKAMQFTGFHDYVNLDMQLVIINPDSRGGLDRRQLVDHYWKVAKGMNRDGRLWAWGGDEAGLKVAKAHWAKKLKDIKAKQPRVVRIKKPTPAEQKQGEIDALNKAITDKDARYHKLEAESRFKDERITSLEDALDNMRLRIPQDALDEHDKIEIERSINKGHRIKELEDQVRTMRSRHRFLVEHNEELSERNMALQRATLDEDVGSDVEMFDPVEADFLDMAAEAEG